ncbi:TPA: DUF1642 domain-containing protein [Streptococcus suis]|nr:DUF1642 domain-containing protein [Streptococcus suis]
MNKQEAKQKLHNIAFAKMNTRPDDLKLADVMQVIDQIDQPQKVVVPKFVAEIIEHHKEINGLLKDVYMESETHCEFEKWLLEVDNAHDIVAHAWLFGYEIEQEQLYTVEIPDPNNNGFIILERGIKGIVLSQFDEYTDWKKESEFQLTESEIKQDLSGRGSGLRRFEYMVEVYICLSCKDFVNVTRLFKQCKTCGSRTTSDFLYPSEVNSGFKNYCLNLAESWKRIAEAVEVE